MSTAQELRLPVRSPVNCPHCWERFPAENTLWISQHPDMLNDHRLGADAQQRFLPTRFNAEGNAIDAGGVACHDQACPNCHLKVPRALYEMSSFFISIVGTPSCGKTYFLASMTWQLRQSLPQHFALSFNDADPAANRLLAHYEERQFLNSDRLTPVKLEKTEEQGDLYSQVRFGDRVVTYPKPFMFTLRPLDFHPNITNAKRISRIVALYDNAGESFEPGKDTISNQVTRHLARSRVVMFLFDPTQDPRFRDACRRSDDPQITSEPVTARQETTLHEIADRVRRHAGLSQHQKHDVPLIVVATKFDAWWQLLGEEKWLNPPRRPTGTENFWALDLQRINEISQRVRALLWRHTPELVTAAEAFASDVLYVPVSATGCGPTRDAETGALGIPPRNIRPMWVEVPFQTALARWGRGVIPIVKPNDQPAGEGAPLPPLR